MHQHDHGAPCSPPESPRGASSEGEPSHVLHVVLGGALLPLLPCMRLVLRVGVGRSAAFFTGNGVVVCLPARSFTTPVWSRLPEGTSEQLMVLSPVDGRFVGYGGNKPESHIPKNYLLLVSPRFGRRFGWRGRCCLLTFLPIRRRKIPPPVKLSTILFNQLVSAVYKDLQRKGGKGTPISL